MEDCGRCSKGPDGLEGHVELTIWLEGQPPYGAGDGHHTFRCLACATPWRRYYDGGGTFRWERARP